MNANNRVDGLLLFDALDCVRVAQIHLDRVTGRRDLVTLDPNWAKYGWKTIPLRFVAVRALSDREGVREGCSRRPEGEVLQGGLTGEQLHTFAI